jgi:hypothetical protein
LRVVDLQGKISNPSRVSVCSLLSKSASWSKFAHMLLFCHMRNTYFYTHHSVHDSLLNSVDGLLVRPHACVAIHDSPKSRKHTRNSRQGFPSFCPIIVIHMWCAPGRVWASTIHVGTYCGSNTRLAAMVQEAPCMSIPLASKPF